MTDGANVLVQIRADDDRPIYAQIVDEVRRAVLVGALEGDDPLPSVRDLASDLRVNPNTVSRAYQELEREGLVYVRRGRGTFVAPDAGQRAGGREELARRVGERALRDARRYSLTVEELVAALRDLAAASGGEDGGEEDGGGDVHDGDEGDVGDEDHPKDEEDRA